VPRVPCPDPRAQSGAFLYLTVVALLIGLVAGTPAAEIRFVDGSESSGIPFVHVTGASGEKYVMESISSGCGLFDYDGDGDLDIYMVNGAPLPGYRSEEIPRNRLYRNEGREKGWTFTDVTESSGAGDTGYGMACTVGDYDNDGDLDLHVTNYGPNVMYRNEGDGTFTDVTAEAGLGVDDKRWSASAAFVDIDQDGDLDLYVVNYVRYDLGNNWRCTLPGTDIRAYCHPDFYPPLADVLYRNNGDGTFTDVSKASGVFSEEGKGLGIVCGDFDLDGSPDIFVTNDSVANFLFLNRGDGSFDELGMLSGTSHNWAGDAEAGMGVSCADIEGDGDLDITIGHLAKETDTLYRNEGDGSFTDATPTMDLSRASRSKVTFGLAYLDADNDGDPDLFAANGHVVDNLHLIPGDITYRQTNQVFENVNGVLTDASADAGPGLEIKKASRGLAAGDVDNDGDVDVLINNMGERFDLLLNEGGKGNGWLTVKLVGAARPVEGQKVGRQEGRVSNRDAIGAKVRVVSGDLDRIKEVRSAYSYCSASDLRVHFGLGKRAAVDTVEISWPSGARETIMGVTANRLLVVHERGEVSETNWETGEVRVLRPSP
jgi:enediyne biosynthesis protein E4